MALPLTVEQQAVLEAIVHKFEQVWFRGQRPVIEKFVPPDVAIGLRRAILVELVHIDREMSRKAGENALSAENYISRFPELSSDTSLLQGALTIAVPQSQIDSQPGQGAARIGSRTTHLSMVMPGTVLGGTYEISEVISVGGMGIVFKAEHSRMQRTVAIKMLRPSLMDDPGMVTRFQREAVAVAKLTHPNIVTAYDALEIDGNYYLVMEYVQGVDLARYIQEHGPLPVETAVSYVLQAACGMQYAHRQGLIHRDIKPANLMLDVHGTIKILDMGLARLRKGINHATSADDGTALTEVADIMGTIDFMSPEQSIDSHHVGRSSDVYSLGCTLYYLLTRKPLYGGPSVVGRILAHREAAIPSLCAARAEVPAELDAIFQRMVAKKKEDRYRSMTPLIADLNNWCADGSPPSSLNTRRKQLPGSSPHSLLTPPPSFPSQSSNPPAHQTIPKFSSFSHLSNQTIEEK